MKEDFNLPKELPLDIDPLERLVREGARKLIQEALVQELEDFLGRNRYERRQQGFRGYRNGFGKTRSIALSVGHVTLRVPRASDVPAEVAADGFRSKILPRYARASATTKGLLVSLYLEGLSSGDFEPIFRELLGESAPLSAASIIRLKEVWKQAFETWKNQPLEKRYAYIWVDGIYLKAGLEKEKTALLVVIGVNENGEKELLAIHEGYRESKESWSEVLRDLRHRGVEEIALAIGDGALGTWSAFAEVFPKTRWQRCWNHKVLNVMDKLPNRLHAEVKKELRDIWQAPTVQECRRRGELLAKKLRLMGQAKAAETLLRDFEHFTTFYDFPQEHWVHLRTSNAIESTFAGVRLRSNVTKRMRSQETALYLVFKLIRRLSENWRTVNSPELVHEVLEGKRFIDGVQEKVEEVKKAA